MEKKQEKSNRQNNAKIEIKKIGVIGVFSVLILIAIIYVEFLLFPEGIQIYAPNLHVFIQITLLFIALVMISVGFYSFKKLAKKFDDEFNG